MPVKIRLARRGKKLQPFYHIVVADSRAPRDGKYIEKIGVYNPRTRPATIEIDQQKALDWLNKGAQPSDTCRAILSYKGVLYKKYLDEGVKRGVITQDTANAKFTAWQEEKNLKISQHRQGIINKMKDDEKSHLALESKVREKVREKIAAKRVAESEAIAQAAKEAAKEAEAAASETSGQANEETPENQQPE
ncbi:MAG: 30S ribosomal protein S16 [Bacteroidia bacterium]|nr:30S ribosomal protein S16 [Bacteroidia bacterium]MCZ2276596.1 30S ribosomal protein S16 [Bacteroidia bacterium]